MSIEVLDRRPSLGGRVYSYPHPALAETVDSQHVILGCCTNIIDLMEQAGAGDSIRWYDEFLFIEPGGRHTRMKAGILPAPSHLTMSFLRAGMLGVGDKIAIARGMTELVRGRLPNDSESFRSWLTRTRQTDRAVRHFWEPVAVGTLNDALENCSAKYAGKVIYESLLRSPEAGRFGIPALPLSEWLTPLIGLAAERGVDIRTSMGVTGLEQINESRWRVITEDTIFEASNVILAVDFKQAQQLLAGLPAGAEFATNLNHYVAAPITTVHLWYDSPLVGVDHAALLDTRIQWVFNKSRIRRSPASQGTYLELSISASWPELKQSREEILASALREFALFFPEVKSASLTKSGVLKEARATFSVTPGLDTYRPSQKTQWPGLYLAGDWTSTEWPSTMEGAVRSGRLAAGMLAGGPTKYLAPELPATGWMPLLVR